MCTDGVNYVHNFLTILYILQEECDKILQAAKAGDVDVITAMFKDDLYVDAIVDDEVCT